MQGPAPGGQVAGPPGLVQRQRLHGVARDGGQQGLLVTALRHPQADGTAAADGQPLRDRLRFRRQRRDQDLTGNAAPGTAGGAGPGVGRVHGLLTVDLPEEVLDQLAGRHVLDLFQHPAALAAHPAVADVEDLDGRFELVLGQRDDVAVGPVPEHDGLLFQRPLQRAHVVPQPRRALVLLGRRGLPHLRLDPADEPGGLAGHEVAEVLGELAVLGRAHPVHARCRALADVTEQARAADLPGALEHPGRARPDREDPEQGVDRVPDRPGVRVGPEVPGALPLRAPHHHDPRVLLTHGHRKVRVALVVPVLDVVPGIELLDPGILELERLHLGADDGPVDRGRRRQHGLRPRVQAGEVRKVGVQPLPQGLGLPHVDDPSASITEPVDPGRLGDGAGGRPIGCRICHAVTLRRPGDSPCHVRPRGLEQEEFRAVDEHGAHGVDEGPQLAEAVPASRRPSWHHAARSVMVSSWSAAGMRMVTSGGSARPTQ